MADRFSDEPPRRQHQYSTADQKSKLPWKKWLGLALCCVIVIICMILFSLFMQWAFNPEEEKDWTDDGVPNGAAAAAAGEATGEAPLLPKDAQFIQDVCTADKLDVNERSFCEDACAPALDCCDPYGSANSTCFAEETSGCFNYAKCHSLDGFSDPAHVDLDRICSPAGIEVNREECERACNAMTCCYSEPSCIADRLQACLDYAPCQNLREGNQKIDVAPTDLADRCEKQTPTCKRDCREATCCSDVTSECYKYNFIACLSYASCTDNSDTTVRVAALYSKLQPAAVDLDEYCSPAGINQHGIAPCQLACQEAACCFQNAAMGGCFGADPLGCLEYEPCVVLKEPQYAGLTIPPGATLPPQKGATAAPAGNTTSSSSSSSVDVTVTQPPSGNETIEETGAASNTTTATSTQTAEESTVPPDNNTTTLPPTTDTNTTASDNGEEEAVTATTPPENGRNLRVQ